jgi:hypothetical protein
MARVTHDARLGWSVNRNRQRAWTFSKFDDVETAEVGTS